MSNTPAQLRAVSHLPYLNWVRKELKLVQCKVRRWYSWSHDKTYWAEPDTRSLWLPIPECEFSFMVCLHEIGHVDSGLRQHEYLSEYNAERWAIKRATRYGVTNKKYEVEAKRYVRRVLYSNMIHDGISHMVVKPHVLRWIGTSHHRIYCETKRITKSHEYYKPPSIR